VLGIRAQFPVDHLAGGRSAAAGTGTSLCASRTRVARPTFRQRACSRSIGRPAWVSHTRMAARTAGTCDQALLLKAMARTMAPAAAAPARKPLGISQIPGSLGRAVQPWGPCQVRIPGPGSSGRPWNAGTAAAAGMVSLRTFTRISRLASMQADARIAIRVRADGSRTAIRQAQCLRPIGRPGGMTTSGWPLALMRAVAGTFAASAMAARHQTDTAPRVSLPQKLGGGCRTVGQPRIPRTDLAIPGTCPPGSTRTGRHSSSELARTHVTRTANT
jgi:hypothetical protein